MSWFGLLSQGITGANAGALAGQATATNEGLNRNLYQQHLASQNFWKDEAARLRQEANDLRSQALDPEQVFKRREATDKADAEYQKEHGPKGPHGEHMTDAERRSAAVDAFQKQNHYKRLLAQKVPEPQARAQSGFDTDTEDWLEGYKQDRQSGQFDWGAALRAFSGHPDATDPNASPP